MIVVKKLNESGYREALFGLSLSYGKNKAFESGDISEEEFYGKMANIAQSLCKREGGENKFLRQISVWLDVSAPLYWWKQADQYKVGTVTQSESTMHTLMKCPVTEAMFETDSVTDTEGHYLCSIIIPELEELRQKYVEMTENAPKGMLPHELREYYKDRDKYKKDLIALLPQSFIQRRIWSLNYAVLRNIRAHRSDHFLKEWWFFCKTIPTIVDHPELLLESY